MNTQEFIERMKSLKNLFGNKSEYVEIDAVIEFASELDEPQKVTIPQFVADYIKDAKYYEWGLDDVFDHIAEESEESEIYKWFYTLGNIDVFARAWLDGYTVVKEKKYHVRFKGMTDGCNYLNYRKIIDEWFLGGKSEPVDYRTRHTRKELEEAGFGWVFDCPGIEIEEVENE
ncbi:DUF1642 domain-containing protein [Streptococcus parasanguinis]|uniref:DUF1642 domain-containing protein n=1 Tax=Streptococcus parasanguinis TaxID=1318 RepID=UPI00200112B3|nr:DUF1642 domain-containing protein [Streptococcus parasanguinis]